jgi:uncharacterized protein YneF (UPF0154 family)
VSVPIWLFFLALSAAFCLGWSLGSVIARAAVQEEAREIARLEAELIQAMKLRPADQNSTDQPAARTLGRAG